LGKCEKCASSPSAQHRTPNTDSKALLYGHHFGPLAQRVVDQGRRPGVWGDMFFDHPTALDAMPKSTLIFDWQYFKSPLETSRMFQEKGFEVVCCPSLQTYNSVWFHLSQSEANVRDAAEAARELDAYGVCITTWECAVMGNYETILPAIEASGALLAIDATPVGPRVSELASGARSESRDPTGAFIASYSSESNQYAQWARLMGVDLQAVGGSFGWSGIRSSLKTRLLLQANPFLAWLYHHEEFSGDVGDKALAILDHAISIAPDASTRGVSEFVRGGIEFVRYADQARQAYANSLPGVATATLAPCRQIFENMERTARATHLRIGGSLADIERCRVAREHVERVIKRIKEFGDGSLGYLPAFEHITHPKFMPHDQAAWWLINDWANE